LNFFDGLQAGKDLILAPTRGQVNPAAWRPGHTLLGAKCLGAPGLLRCGLVTGTGVIRDGIQRNIEVAYHMPQQGNEGTTISGSSSGVRVGGGEGEILRSLYPSFALCEASHVIAFPDDDRTSLVAALQRLAGLGCRAPSFDAEGLVSLHGADAWSRVWFLPQLSSRAKQKSCINAFLKWQLARKLSLRSLISAPLQALLDDIQRTNTIGLTSAATQRDEEIYWQWNYAAEAEAQRIVCLLSNFCKLSEAAFVSNSIVDALGNPGNEEKSEMVWTKLLRKEKIYHLQGSSSKTLLEALERPVAESLYAPGRGHMLGMRIWLNATDAAKNTVMHHCARLGLRQALLVLSGAGASMWAENAAGETPTAIDLGLQGAGPSALHRACFFGRLLETSREIEGMDRGAAAGALFAMAAASPMDYCPPKPLVEVKNLIAQRQPWEALMQARALVDVIVHSRVYLAAAMLAEGFGVKAVLQELDKYLNQLLVCSSSEVIDPMLYFVRYRIWVESGRPRAGILQLSAAYALKAVKHFPDYANLLTNDDDLDQIAVQLECQGNLGKHSSSAKHNPAGRDQYQEGYDCEEREPYGSELEWNEVKKLHDIRSDAMDTLMGLVGLASIKQLAIQIVKDVLLVQSRPAQIQSTLALNLVLLGNPGCGKTKAALLLGRAMVELGFKWKSTFAELNALNILKEKSDPVNEFEKKLNVARGGIVLVDDAHLFSPSKVGEGQRSPSNGILDCVKEAIDVDDINKRYNKGTTFILAGHKEELEAVLGSSVGLASCFTKIIFDDFDDTQLKSIMLQMLRERGLRLQSTRECGTPLATVLTQRIARYKRTKGFGNARAVRQQVNDMILRQTNRLGTLLLKGTKLNTDDHQIIMRDDALGPSPDSASVSMVLKELEAMVGLGEMKEAIHKLVDLQKSNYDRELRGEHPELISLHRVFHGNPGTGKTTVARIYGALLKHLGLLSNGDFLQCTPADLTGDAEGGAAANTKAILERARGKVLFIDEAYVLDPNRKGNQYGGNVLDTLVEKLEGEAGSDVAVILAGYSREMFDMLEINPGLRRRFNIDDFGVLFEDLSDTDLRKVCE
jgi:DNA polymerase III delta prime subunit